MLTKQFLWVWNLAKICGSSHLYSGLVENFWETYDIFGADTKGVFWKSPPSGLFISATADWLELHEWEGGMLGVSASFLLVPQPSQSALKQQQEWAVHYVITYRITPQDKIQTPPEAHVMLLSPKWQRYF